MRVGFCTILDGTSAEHLAAGSELRMNFEADGEDVLGHDGTQKRTRQASIQTHWLRALINDGVHRLFKLQST